MGAGGGEIAQDLAPEAVVAYARDAALDARLVTRMAHPGGIDVEASGLGVLAEGRDDPRVERVGGVHDRLGIVRNEDGEDPTEEGPGRLARLDRARRRLAEARVDEAVARVDRGEDPGPEAAPAPVRVGGEQRHPSGVDLDLLPGAAVGHRHRRGRAPEAEGGDREAPQRRVGQVHTLPPQELADLGEPDPLREVCADDRLVPHALDPRRPVGPRRDRLERDHDHRDTLVRQRGRTVARPQARPRRRPHVAAHGLGVESELRGDPLARHALHPEPEHLLHVDHRDLPIRHPPLPAAGIHRRHREDVWARSRRPRRGESL